MKHILLTILVIVVFWLGKTFAMIVMYASPDNTAHTLHGSIYVLGSAIFIFSVYYNLENTLHNVLKWILSILGIYGVLNTLGFSYVAIFSERIQDEKDINAAIIFLISSLFMGIGTFFMLKNTKQRVKNA